VFTGILAEYNGVTSLTAEDELRVVLTRHCHERMIALGEFSLALRVARMPLGFSSSFFTAHDNTVV